MATRFFAAYNGLLAAVQTALPAITVYDGPQAKIPTDRDFVLVGVQNALDTGMTLAIDGGQQDWAAIIANNLRPRDEEFVIYSTLVAWTGDNNLPDCRSRADTNLSAIETQIRNDLSLGGALNTTYLNGWCGISVVSLEQTADTTGWAVHVLFAVACRTRI